ncbi:hypothetical protein [Salmonella enterica]|nr:hypothetical protein [Salmonella enterica]EEJ6656594.1 hypothetical protein [Salmonella enterica subsp. enterica serovar Redlands]EGO1729095.1 hypothetical protein [Salmonella enterica]
MKTRDDRPSFALSCRLNLPALLRWLLMVFVLAGICVCHFEMHGLEW